MTQPPSPHPEDAFDLYVDGLLGDEERRAFEKALEADAPLRERLEAQRRVDAALREAFAPPANMVVGVHVRRALAAGGAPGNGSVTAGESRPRAEAPAGRSGWARWASTPISAPRWAVAAGLLVLLCGPAMLMWRALGPAAQPHWPGGYAQVVHGDMGSVYEQMVRSGFQAGWECPPPVFRATLASRFGQPVEMGDFPGDIEHLGLAYADSLSPSTLTLLARVEGRPVVVFMDRASRAPADTASPAPGLHLYRKIVGEVVLLELSPLDHPRVIEHLRAPDPS